MDQETVFLFITFCGLGGIFLRRDFLNIIASLAQITLGTTALIGLKASDNASHKYDVYFIILIVFALVIFSYAISVLLIRRRSTLQVNELTELRG